MLSNQPIKMTIKPTQQTFDHIFRKGGRPHPGGPIAHHPLQSADNRDHHRFSLNAGVFSHGQVKRTGIFWDHKSEAVVCKSDPSLDIINQ
jgi:hypothetical protein